MQIRICADVTLEWRNAERDVDRRLNRKAAV